jgi:phytanoyl-CoA hydroxylase
MTANDNMPDPDGDLADAASIRAHYHKEGYVVLRRVIPAELCDQAKLIFEQEVKTYKKPLYRWSTQPELHVFDEHGHMLNALLNVHSLDDTYFLRIKSAVLSILAHKKLCEIVRTLTGEDAILVQTIYFESNQATPAHHDSYYVDSSVLGRMIGAWVAVEDIHPDAEQFYICPGSHKLDTPKNSGEFDVAFHHVQYQAFVEEMIKTYKLERRTPVMQKGDVIFWTAKTIHGSLAARDPSASRSSITGHFIPASTSLVHMQKIPRKLDVRHVNDVLVHFPKDQTKFKNRLIYSVETHFPRLFSLLKRVAIKALIK